MGLTRRPWSSAASIRKVFRDAFAAVGLPYANPHSYRKTLVRLGQRLCQTPEEWKAWSQNMGHSNVLTTLQGYGHVSTERQGDILAQLPRFGETPLVKVGAAETLAKMAEIMKQHGA